MSGPEPFVVLGLAAIGLTAAFFAARPEIWEWLFFAPIDPRPVALMRIAFGGVVLWNFLMLAPLVPTLFTDEGMWLTDMARARYGAPPRSFGSLSVLHLRNDPPLVFALYAALLATVALMTAGAWTGWTTPLSWLLVHQFYAYTPTTLYGADRVLLVYLFLAMFSAWGDAYSIDSWRARRREVFGTAAALPARPGIPPWPVRLMMLQLALIYCSSGLLKTGITWRDGTALYYVLNADDLYRFPAQASVTWLHHVGVLPVATWLTRGWEVLFPVVLVGVALQCYERDRQQGRWPSVDRRRQIASWVLAAGAWGAVAGVAGIAGAHAMSGAIEPSERRTVATSIAVGMAVLPAIALPLCRLVRARWPGGHRFLLHWILGRRTWLGFGVLFHVGIEAGTNLGVFPAIMLAVYLGWLDGRHVDRLVAFLWSRPARPGEGNRPLRRTRWERALHGLGDWIRYRVPNCPVEVRYHPDEAGIRRAALVRLLAPRACERFVADATLPVSTVRVDPSGAAPRLLSGGCRRFLAAVGRL